ncbi:hypothetical protein BRUC_2227 [Brucella melitensis]
MQHMRDMRLHRACVGEKLTPCAHSGAGVKVAASLRLLTVLQ